MSSSRVHEMSPRVGSSSEIVVVHQSVLDAAVSIGVDVGGSEAEDVEGREHPLGDRDLQNERIGNASTNMASPN